ncbi:MAG: acetyl/propionyl/methylcrotonyl-CoA carboxylase subunit alpha [Parasphingorhabdus sp.]|uniref:acetyl/propionyl/methylcrotonyl-CoA carboxylase subunit alpha n=1 Tax=Parasphingorhabdus sp. TaxID=2709688 RepID=UPI0030031D0B
MMKSLLIANRGEIACRIIRTARAMGIRTIAVYSDADAHAMHVKAADEAVHIGPSPAAESYLVADKILAAAKQTGAEAIHPGYGFLSENADFAQSVIDAGLIWVGPKPASIRDMGLKDAAKKLMTDAGVPVTPGYQGDNQSPDHLAKEAEKIGYPVLIKAVAGGGGKGMRKVDVAADFLSALSSCQREAEASFGNDIVLIEKWINNPRHIEVQVFGDSHGNIVHLFERDCSLQRRHQKVIEEAPAPGMDETTRSAICAAAVRAAKAVNYENAGTIEFIADASGALNADKIWFMEMNTRLQVEHPVTEAITGVDLVEWQLRVAAGEQLPKSQDELSIHGWAMEVRLYAEDASSGFLPSIGKLETFSLNSSGTSDEARIDTGVGEGSEITPYYDPMIAKVIVHSDTRAETVKKLCKTLSDARVGPLTTNAGFLFRLASDTDFGSGNVDTGLIERRGETLTDRPMPSQTLLNDAASRILGAGSGPFHHLSGFRINAPQKDALSLTDQYGTLHSLSLPIPSLAGSATCKPEPAVTLYESGERYTLSLPRTDAGHANSAAQGAILAPMPGRIIAVEVSSGQKVKMGDKLITLEAMKMEHSLTAPFDGIVTELAAKTGEQVTESMLLIKIEQEE